MAHSLLKITETDDLECYYCESDAGTPCNADITGGIIKCQMHSSEEPHYGDVCAIGHTGEIFYNDKQIV